MSSSRAKSWEQRGSTLPPAGHVHPAEIELIDQERPAGRAVEPAEELDQRALAGAVLADERDRRAGGEVQVDVLERRLRRAGVAEGDALERDASPHALHRDPLVRHRHLLLIRRAAHLEEPAQPRRGLVDDAQQLQDRRHLHADLRRERDDEHDVADRCIAAPREQVDEQHRPDVRQCEQQLPGAAQPDLAAVGTGDGVAVRAKQLLLLPDEVVGAARELDLFLRLR
ncbi:MAG: hypothetical protein M3P48_03065 [Actinomycetota bacterium]|nr:hypothetical protein [Actinomycetota bacterium]